MEKRIQWKSLWLSAKNSFFSVYMEHFFLALFTTNVLLCARYVNRCFCEKLTGSNSSLPNVI